MTQEEKELVIEFYDEEVWSPGIPKGSELKEKEIRIWYRTLGFAKWNLAYQFDKVVLKPMERILDKLFSK